jgi:hypothetical protein
MRKRMAGVVIVVLGLVAAVAAQQHPASAMPAKQMSGDAAKVQRATTAGPADITKHAAVVEMDAKGTMRELRKGSNGWTCMLIATGPATSESMCGDQAWSAWGDAYMSKKAPATKTFGVAYMLHGDHGASNTDPFATGPTAANDWVVSPAHLMLLVPDSTLLDSLPTDPHAGGPFVMWKGTPYAHIMVPIASMPAAMKPAPMPMKKQ